MQTKSTSPHDDDDAWLRQFVVSEEYVIRHYPSLRGGFYRRFESKNVIDLVRERRLRAKRRGSGEAA